MATSEEFSLESNDDDVSENDEAADSSEDCQILPGPSKKPR